MLVTFYKVLELTVTPVILWARPFMVSTGMCFKRWLSLSIPCISIQVWSGLSQTCWCTWETTKRTDVRPSLTVLEIKISPSWCKESFKSLLGALRFHQVGLSKLGVPQGHQIVSTFTCCAPSLWRLWIVNTKAKESYCPRISLPLFWNVTLNCD